ncbi:MAG: hypothetical protein HC771_01945 [Synechococcales cyanobacterium CRU_2_2]|nr:hypothetical protein [Synechococcales cyanobacterium CRU_2_2]
MNDSLNNPPTGDSSAFPPGDARSGQSLRSPEDYLDQLSADTRAALNADQLAEVQRVIALALPNPAPKVLDVRFGINVLFARYFVVFFLGKERRKNARDRKLSWLERLGNGAIAVLLLLSMNLFVSLSLVILLYLIKSAVGIDLFDDKHLSDQFN